MSIPTPVAEALAKILEAAADGEQVLVRRSPEDLTTEQAAAVLGVSRPAVVRLIEAGKLSARMVGTHRRLALRETYLRTARHQRGGGATPSTRWSVRPKNSASTTDARRHP